MDGLGYGIVRSVRGDRCAMRAKTGRNVKKVAKTPCGRSKGVGGMP